MLYRLATQFLLFSLAVCIAPAIGDEPLTLELIMSDSEWIGRSPESPHWSVDGKSVYYQRKQKGSELRDLWKLDPNKPKPVRVEVPGPESAGSFDVTRAGDRKVFTWGGDLYLYAKAKLTRLTRTEARESSPRFTEDERGLLFRRDDDYYLRDLDTGFERQLAVVRIDDPPKDETPAKDFLSKQERELFEQLQRQAREKRLAQEREKRLEEARRDETIPKLYLGKGRSIRRSTVDPSAKWAAIAHAAESSPKSDGRRDSMPVWIVDDAYVQNRSVRSLVGTGQPNPQSLTLFHLESQKTYKFEFDKLPGVADDPLQHVKAEVASWTANQKSKQAEAAEAPEPASTTKDGEGAKAEEAPSKPRPVFVGGLTFSDTAHWLLVECFSFDNKDRWISVVDLRNPKKPKLKDLHHERDPAWINRRIVDVGWLPEQDALFVVSEESGYAHLIVVDADSGKKRVLTEGTFEVTNVTPTRLGKRLFFTANESHPGIHEVWSVDVETGKLRQETKLRGRNTFRLSPDESQLLVTHSERTKPNELMLVNVNSDGTGKQLTRTASKQFKKIEWVEPQVVQIPNRHGDPVYARLYLPKEPAKKRRPAVVFVHGAGYLQNAHYGWSLYFREFMFHSLLTRRGFVVLDMDYRASAGYGRNWRAAIYRRMGEPELEDLQDGVDWLVQHQQVDRQRVGVYGGSYGGFMTLMALFRSPGLFACGAALRPVTDWAHYNHGYTSNILNTPEVDPIAFHRSSPIHFASGLRDPLLMCHGMLDDNVFFKDTVRLTQRLIELKKEDWETAIYPVEPHGFRTPSSWLDEYRRILRLFETHLRE